MSINYKLILVNKKLLTIVAFFSFFFVFSQKETSSTEFTNMLNDLLSHTVNEVLPSEIKNNEEVIFLDAREKKEFEVSHIKNAQWIGYDNFRKKNVEQIPKDTPVIVYCTVGYRSEKIAEKLKKMGYSDVSNLYGGIFEWYHQDKKLFHETTETQKIHTYNKDWSQWLLKGEKVF